MKRTKTIGIMAGIVWALTLNAGLMITAENDIFMDSDDNYSHGSEIEWAGDPVDHGNYFGRTGYGFDQLMYTPMEISGPYMPPATDRPWCGTLSIYREDWYITKTHEFRLRYEIGALGPHSYAEESQTNVHRWLGCTTPMGWDNQMPDEAMLNFYGDDYITLWRWDLSNRFSTDVKGIAGATLGSTFINGRSGVQGRLGYNIPAASMPGGIAPKGIQKTPGFFVYGIAGVQEYLVLHNATLGSSFIRDRDYGQERELEALVPEEVYGLVWGFRNFSMSYLLYRRGEEFKGQDDGNMTWGMIRLEFVKQFF